MNLLGDALAFLDEPIPSFYFEVTIEDLPDLLGGSFGDALGGLAQMAVGALSSAVLGAESSSSSSFQSVSGLELSYQTEGIKEGGWASPRPSFSEINNGEVTFVRYLRAKHLGIGSFSFDPFSEWCEETMECTKTWNKQVKTKNITINVYHPAIKNPLPVGPSSIPIAGFILREAFPVKWGISDLDSTNDSDPIKETIVVKYTEIERLKMELPF